MGCSAFQFHKESVTCDLGSKFNLLMSQPNDQKQLTNISINTDGKHLLLNNSYIKITVSKMHKHKAPKYLLKMFEEKTCYVIETGTFSSHVSNFPNSLNFDIFLNYLFDFLMA